MLKPSYIQKIKCFPIRLHSHNASSSNENFSSSIDSKEVAKFSELSSDWGNELGSFHALHSLNQLRIPWIIDNVKKTPNKISHVVDVGSGGGLLSVPLARSGFNVTGIDATKQAIDAANLVIKSKPLETAGISKRIRFKHISVEDFSSLQENKSKYDAVVASEILEHVADVGSFIKALGSLARPGAPIFLTTINRTLISKVAAIWLAENVLHLVPPGVHDWNKFLKPEKVEEHLKAAGCRIKAVHGMMFHPIGNHWTWIESTQCNYAILAVKQ